MQPNDGQLLARFLQNRDEHAFEELVKRHAGMVMAVCRRVLGDAHDAEEAFQNTFLVLIRKAGVHLQAESIGGWLYNVATRTALDMRGKRLTQASRFVEQEEIEMIPQTEESISMAWEAMKGLLDEELIQLADKYRRPLVLCYVEGKDPDEAAVELDMNHNTFRIRLMRGRELLRKRLVRRGIVASVNLLNAVLLEKTQAAEVVSEVLIQSTVKAATTLLSTAAGVTAITVVSKLTLLKGMVMNMIYSKTALVIGGLALGSMPFLVWGNIHKNKSIQPSASIVQSVKDGGVSNQAMAAIKESSPPSRNETVTSVPDKNVSASNSTNLLPVSSARDFLLCFKLASELPDSKERWQILRKLGINLSDEDFDNAWNTLLKELTRANRTDKNFNNLGFQMAVFDEWLKKDPMSAVNLAYHLSKLPEQDATTALAILNDDSLYNIEPNSVSVPFFAMSDEITIVGDGEYKYQGVAGTFIALPDTKPFLSFLLKRWAVQDYQAALAWVKDLPDDKEHQSMLKVVELGETIQTALNNANPKEGLETLFSIEKEFHKSANYRFSLNPEVGAIGTKWAEKDINAALDWVNSQTGRTPAILSAQSKIYETWTKNDFPAVLALITQSTNYYPGRAEQKIAETWIETDQQSALDWMEQVLSSQEIYDKYRKNLAMVILNRWSRGDPEGAVVWWTQKYQCVKTEDDRRSLDNIISNWKNVDPESANQWVQTSLSPAMRDSMEHQHQRDKKFMIVISDETARDKYHNFMKDEKNADKVKDEAFMDKFTEDLLKEIRERSGKSAGE